MLSRISVALLGLVLLPGTLLGFEAQATVQQADAEQGVLVVFGGGRQRTVKVAQDATFLDAQGKPLAGGLAAKELKAGAAVMLSIQRGENGPVIHGVRLGGKGSPALGGRGGPAGPPSTGQSTVGFRPLTEMTASDQYKGEEGGLYGSGQNEPPETHRQAAARETAKIAPLDASGKPSGDGTIVLVSISMSNATQEFSTFKRVADADPRKSPRLTIVDCAQGGQTMARWADANAPAWAEAQRRLQAAGVTLRQVQVAWIKLANARPSGELGQHGKQLESDTMAVLENAKARFPNLRVAYLGSRIYGGWADGQLNPEPFAYEGAFVVRWLIQAQMQGNAGLNYDANRGAVKSPLLLWGPYLWADGTTPRKSDGLVWQRQDLGPDGTHPSESGRQKVADQLLKFFEADPLAKTWFVQSGSP
jgi:hypothetical protein